MYESCVLRDGDPNEYNGMSVHKAVDNVNNIIAPRLIGMDVTDQAAIDQAMIDLDGTPDKHVLGGNAIYSVSVAAYRAAAASVRKELYEYIAEDGIKTVPIPSFNVINGGRHAGNAQSGKVGTEMALQHFFCLFQLELIASAFVHAAAQAVEQGVLDHGILAVLAKAQHLRGGEAAQLRSGSSRIGTHRS